MTRGLKVEIISKETIKPSSPTPPHLRSFKLSLYDQLASAIYKPLVLFYPISEDHDNRIIKFTKRSQCLKRSLSDTLTQFFPLAGKIKDSVSVDCNDEGVDYFEAHVDCLLEDILKQPEDDVLKHLVPVDDTFTEAIVGCQMLFQINLFKCGGIAIGVSFSHKLIDAATFSTFLKAWSAAALEESGKIVVPDFTIATHFPPSNDKLMSPPLAQILDKYVKKRFVFDASKLVALKAKTASASVPTPTRVEAVSALIWKCAMTASRSNSKSSIKSFVLCHTVNMRKRLVPPLPENSFGNAVGINIVQTEESATNLETLVDLLRKQMIDFCDRVTKLPGKNAISMHLETLAKIDYMLKTDSFKGYGLSSWCRFPLYEADFGWGKPTWVGAVISAYKNAILLMDTFDGNGVEACVSLSQEDMALFERDPDLLDFVSVNPSVYNLAT